MGCVRSESDTRYDFGLLFASYNVLSLRQAGREADVFRELQSCAVLGGQGTRLPATFDVHNLYGAPPGGVFSSSIVWGASTLVCPNGWLLPRCWLFVVCFLGWTDAWMMYRCRPSLLVSHVNFWCESTLGRFYTGCWLSLTYLLSSASEKVISGRTWVYVLGCCVVRVRALKVLCEKCTACLSNVSDIRDAFAAVETTILIPSDDEIVAVTKAARKAYDAQVHGEGGMHNCGTPVLARFRAMFLCVADRASPEGKAAVTGVLGTLNTPKDYIGFVATVCVKEALYTSCSSDSDEAREGADAHGKVQEVIYSFESDLRASLHSSISYLSVRESGDETSSTVFRHGRRSCRSASCLGGGWACAATVVRRVRFVGGAYSSDGQLSPLMCFWIGWK